MKITTVQTATAKNQAEVVGMIRSVTDLMAYIKHHEEQYFEYPLSLRYLSLDCSANIAFSTSSRSFFPAGSTTWISRYCGPSACSCRTSTSSLTSVIAIQKFTSHVVYILSHPSLNAVISNNYHFENEEVTINYVAFIKGLAIRLDSDTVIFAYNDVRSRARSV